MFEHRAPRTRSIAFGLLALLAATSACEGEAFKGQMSAGAGASNGGAAARGGEASGGDAAAGSGSHFTSGGAGNFTNGGASSAGSASTTGGASDGGAVGASAGGTANTGGVLGAAGAAGAGGASECPCKAPTPTCEAGKCIARGPAMTKAAGYFIDSTEVTVGQYAAFQKAKGDDPSGQPAECSWNTSFDPVFDPKSPNPSEKVPVTNVNYCDAVAFCAWADKRLCGKIGGGDLQFAELADPQKSQWFAACAGPSQSPYSYGPTYQQGYCNDSNDALVSVGSEPKCEGYYPNLFDMIDNAQEWVAACNGNSGAMDGCERIGGSYRAAGMCSQSGLALRNATAPDVGFRCCSE